MKHGKRSEADVGKIPMVWSGGCDGVITPHATVFARNDRKGPASKSRLTIGTAMSATLLPEDIGRLTMVEKVAEAVRAAMRNAGISDPADVHYVQTKTPLLTIESVREAEAPAPDGQLRGARLDGCLERNHRARHCGRAHRDCDAARRADLQGSRFLFVGRFLFLGRRAQRGADRAARQRAGSRRPVIASGTQ